MKFEDISPWIRAKYERDSAINQGMALVKLVPCKLEGETHTREFINAFVVEIRRRFEKVSRIEITLFYSSRTPTSRKFGLWQLRWSEKTEAVKSSSRLYSCR
jgi:hypothetical protein